MKETNKMQSLIFSFCLLFLNIFYILDISWENIVDKYANGSYNIGEVMNPTKIIVYRGCESYQNRVNGYIGCDVAIINVSRQLKSSGPEGHRRTNW